MAARRRSLTFWRLATTVCLLLTSIAYTAATATTAVAASGSAMTVLQSDAQVDYPRSIDFHVVAQSTGQIIEARVAYRADDENVIHLGRADVQSGAHVDVHYLVDLQRAYFPPGVTIHFQWRLIDQTGAEAQTVWSDFTLGDSRFRWHQLAKGNIQIHWHDVDQAFATSVLDTAATVYNSTSGTASPPSANPINIFLYGQLADFRAVLGAGSQEWVGGQTFPQYRVVLLLVSTSDVAGAERSVAHEMIHLRLDAVDVGSVAPLPTWLDEGLAMVAEGPTQPAFQQALEQAAQKHQLYSIQSLSGSFPESPTDATTAYAESESVVRFFLKTYGPAKLALLIDNFRQGMSEDQAFQQTVGTSALDFQNAWESSLSVASLAPTPVADNSSPVLRAIMAPIEAAMGFVGGLIQSLGTPKSKPA